VGLLVCSYSESRGNRGCWRQGGGGTVQQWDCAAAEQAVVGPGSSHETRRQWGWAAVRPGGSGVAASARWLGRW
jgi:hypothetical protein